MKFRMGELFCGPGGLALGATTANVATRQEDFSIVHAWANDYDRDTCETYSRNIRGAHKNSVIYQDVRYLEIEQLSPIDAFAFGI